MKTHIPSHCGNSPKGELIKNLTLLFAKYDVDAAVEFLDENILWTLVGHQPIQGKKAFKEELIKMADNTVMELSIFNLVTHGKAASVNGEMKMKDGKVFGFADFYEFTSASGKMIKSITSYVIEKEGLRR
ncbi:nuclear transport factor 2 family protein [Phaeocystidibacter marisrubri]|uniref:Nuclear transport factor 2 family protein n=1 Tax=Phaeocystidibacter marisrubri TaxID=1577780 RepID=A0A6L3ZI25_9FLAO|nr:nuclear transport factor 2 family protein [Phaeocystidibacter marisrubri]KAB2817514.1 nuclear transport factor 2 family protein [Phaeocystidibacter marisrubri]GGH74967.1 hypothetical protein GCM10011318_21500 [Phaeocystidibacter marisrubri]